MSTFPYSLRERVLRFNQGTNRWYWKHSRRQPHMQHYRARLERCLRGARTAIHLGAGSRDPASLVAAAPADLRIFAVDPSLRSLARNPSSNRVVAWGHTIPLPNASIDVIFSEHVMEHVEDPCATLQEAYRVLRPGGTLLWIAPNLWSYSGLAAHLTPFWFHRLVSRALEPITPRRASCDVFPTHFRINSLGTIRRLLRETGFETEEIYTTSDAPHYTQILPLVHQLAILWHLVLDRFECLASLRVVQIVCARKPDGEGA